MEWQKELTELCKKDGDYRRWLKETERLETSFAELRAAMPPASKEILDAYISACEEMDHAQMRLAYELGKTHGSL